MDARRIFNQGWFRIAGAAVCWAVGAVGAGAQTAADPVGGFKLTAGLYQFARGGGMPGGPGVDVNLRDSASFGNVWLGQFRASVVDVRQTRAGWDNSYTIAGSSWRILPSLQVASGGFWGGSFGVETGDSWFAGVGLGRTNLRNYANLNFDPNDAWMLSGGYRWSSNHSLSLQVVRDNRLNPDQQHVHLVYRTSLEGDQRLTVDLLSKSGLVDGVPIQRLGLSVGYDWPRYFVRFAYDPKVNFTPQDMWRLSTGVRF